MKIVQPMVVLALIAVLLPCYAVAATTEVALATDEQRSGYTIGQSIGGQLKGAGYPMDRAALFAAIGDVLDGRPSRMSEAELAATTQKIQASMRAGQDAKKAAFKQAAKNNAENGDKVYAEALKQKDVIKTASGLAYQVVTKGTGPCPKATDRVRVNYRGTFTDGTEFDSSYARNSPADFPLNAVIPGWTEGVQLMPVGSKYKFWIPAALAYGPADPASERPTGVLMFEIELLEILK